MKNRFYLLFSLVLCSYCHKEQNLYEQSKLHCRENIEFTCKEPQGDFYFKGKLNGKDFCVSNDVEGYYMINSVFSETSTSTNDPVLSPGATPQSSFLGFGFYPPIIDNWNGISKEFAPFVFIRTPSILDSTAHSTSYYLEKFLKEGNLILRDRNIDKYSGFYFDINWICALLPGYNYYYQKDPSMIPIVGEGITPATGTPNDVVFKISEFKKTITPDFVLYDITFQISCNLYYYNSVANKDSDYFGRLEDGVFKTQIIL